MTEKPFLTEGQIEKMKQNPFILALYDCRNGVAMNMGSSVLFQKVIKNKPEAPKSLPDSVEPEYQRKMGEALMDFVISTDGGGKYLLKKVDVFEHMVSPQAFEDILSTAVRNDFKAARYFLDNLDDFMHLECFENVRKYAEEKASTAHRPHIVEIDK